MNIKTLVVGPIEANCYIVSDPAGKEAVIIDPGDEGERIADYVRENNLQVKYLLNTHGHRDHVGANDYLRQVLGAQVAIHCDDEEMLTNPQCMGRIYDHEPAQQAADLKLHNGDELTFGPYTLRVIYTPGHSKGGCCFSEAGQGVCFTGDTLFRGTIGRTDLYGGDYGQLLKSVQERLAKVADGVTIYPGHGPASTMGYERKLNPYMKK